MVESVKVERRCLLWADFSLVHFRVSWMMPNGVRREYNRSFDGFHLLDLPRGCCPMVSHIYTLPYPGHPGSCTPAIVYLVRVHDGDLGLEDVVARIQLRPEPRHDPNAVFECQPLELEGPNIFPLSIIEVTAEA